MSEEALPTDRRQHWTEEAGPKPTHKQVAEWARLQFEGEAARMGRRDHVHAWTSLTEGVEGISPVLSRTNPLPLVSETEDLATEDKWAPPPSDDPPCSSDDPSRPTCILPHEQTPASPAADHQNPLVPPLSRPSSPSFSPLGGVSLGRACLLVALEEEAAIEMHPEVELDVKDLPLG